MQCTLHVKRYFSYESNKHMLLVFFNLMHFILATGPKIIQTEGDYEENSSFG